MFSRILNCLNWSSNFLAYSPLLSIFLLFCSAFLETPLNLPSSTSTEFSNLKYFFSFGYYLFNFKCSYRFSPSPCITSSCYYVFKDYRQFFPWSVFHLDLFCNSPFTISLFWSLFFTLGDFFKCLWILSCSCMFESITKKLMGALCSWIGCASGDLHCRPVILNRDSS